MEDTIAQILTKFYGEFQWETIDRVVLNLFVDEFGLEQGGKTLEAFSLASIKRESIGERLAIRDLMSTLRSSGVKTGGPSVLSQTDRQKFANKLDVMLNR